jgi:hypothetical protein
MKILKKIFESNFVVRFLFALRDRQRIIIGLSKGSISLTNRNIDLTKPSSWEFSGLSQNGEDGIINVLKNQLLKSNRYFIEIGTSDGLENNSAWLLITENFNGLMIEADKKLAERANNILIMYNQRIKVISKFVTIDNIDFLKSESQFLDPDFFSLDIDSMDYYVTKAVLDSGIRPKIFCVEYNSAFGPEKQLTIQYSDNFEIGKDHHRLYYGVSVNAWKKLFHENGYRFVTVDSNGVNAFFVNPEYFDSVFLDNIESNHFCENQFQLEEHRTGYQDQFKLISDLDFYQV